MQNLELNKRLAELLGWTNVVDAGGALLGRPPGGAANSRDQAAVPNWAGDWAAAGPLSTEYRIDISHWEDQVCCTIMGNDTSYVRVPAGNRNIAACQAITRSVIYTLEARP